MPHLFISHSSKDDLAAEAMRRHLVERGWNRKEIFLDLSVEGIAAHEKWKVSLAEANSAANALLCLASPDWLASKESQVERRVAETLAQCSPWRNLRGVLQGRCGFLQAVQEIRGALGMGCGGEDRPLVVFQNLDP